jgi:hypothetical protein
MACSGTPFNEDISKPEIPDKVCAMRRSENNDEDNTEGWLQNDLHELSF